MTNIYIGNIRSDVTNVTVNGDPLDWRLDLFNHSPTGFSWGYAGSGPAQLALAILSHEFGDEFALKNYQRFKSNVIVHLDKDKPWARSSEGLSIWKQHTEKYLWI